MATRGANRLGRGLGGSIRRQNLAACWGPSCRQGRSVAPNLAGLLRPVAAAALVARGWPEGVCSVHGSTYPSVGRGGAGCCVFTQPAWTRKGRRARTLGVGVMSRRCVRGLSWSRLWGIAQGVLGLVAVGAVVAGEARTLAGSMAAAKDWARGRRSSGRVWTGAWPLR